MVTDRALRYRANANPPPGEKRCAFCGVANGIEVGHVDGHEENCRPENLIWTCRSCNVRCANTLRSAGIGRLTRQYNPDGGAQTVAQWVTAVMSMKGLSDAMPVREAVQMIRETPASRRSIFARHIWNNRRKRSNPEGEGIEMSAGELSEAVNAGIIAEDADVILETPARVEVENPRRRRNGRRNPEASAAALYEAFHGTPSTEVVEIVEELHEHSNLATLGVLRELKVITPTNLDACIAFESNCPFLSSNEDGTQLYVRGGEQAVDLSALKLDGDKWFKDLMVLGVCYEVTYQTEKRFHKFKLIDYYHALGEEGGEKPMLIYDTMNDLLTIAGGQYQIRPEGIVN